MAKKVKKVSNVVLENVELKPQVIGHIYQKKSNLGRVIFIFVCFILVVYYINDISVFINNLLGRNTAITIGGNSSGNNKPNNVPNGGNNSSTKEIIYYEFNNNLTISESSLVLNNFKLNNNKLTFDANNNTNALVNLTNKKYFLELYTQNKTLLERIKVDFNSIEAGSKVSFNLDVKESFYYITIVEKSVDDYPSVNYPFESGIMSFTCSKNGEQVNYTFANEKLISLKHILNDSNINDANYLNRYNNYEREANTYNSLEGFTATFNGTDNGYTFIVSIDLEKVGTNNLNNKYYYALNTEPKVVSFEMQTYGFTCK